MTNNLCTGSAQDILLDQDKKIRQFRIKEIQEKKFETKYFANEPDTKIEFSSSYLVDDKYACRTLKIFTLQDMYEEMEKAFYNYGSAHIQTGHYSLSFSIIGDLRYVMDLGINDTWFRWWEPSAMEYTGTIRDYNDDYIDLRMTSSEIRYAQLAFYEIYRYGELTELTMMHFKYFLDYFTRPKYCVIPEELLDRKTHRIL
ncbi:MAG: hypothetical protein IJ566_07215 [Cardiobacteriaceae bacterium]|nr:hypothetical protein [Cardiobacteriaceae bacterium]